ncbi:MAG: hypothetical protein KAY32_08540 [Candidatus Eisenbacteria sp.]|nr:hypothetical protein [Candidatus Eisenbacteria bacterium]
MIDFGSTEAIWLSLTNIALGVVTLVCFVVIAGAVIRALGERVRNRSAAHESHDLHTLTVPELGTTMADGGRRVDEDPTERR